MLDIIKAAGQLGIFPCIVIVILFVIYKAQESKSKENIKQLENDRDSNLANSIIDAIKAVKDVEHTPEDEDNKWRVNEYILDQLNLLIQGGSNRSYFFSYHNGGKDLLGGGYTKMSIIAEKIDISCRPIMKEFQNVPRSMFPILYTTLNKNDVYAISDTEAIRSEDPITYQFFVQHNVKSAIFHSIKATNGMLLGFIGMEYTDSICNDMENAITSIQKKAQRITGALVSRNIEQ